MSVFELQWETPRGLTSQLGVQPLDAVVAGDVKLVVDEVPDGLLARLLIGIGIGIDDHALGLEVDGDGEVPAGQRLDVIRIVVVVGGDGDVAVFEASRG